MDIVWPQCWEEGMDHVSTQPTRMQKGVWSSQERDKSAQTTWVSTKLGFSPGSNSAVAIKGMLLGIFIKIPGFPPLRQYDHVRVIFHP